MIKKNHQPHSSARKKASAALHPSKKAASKASKAATAKSSMAKKKNEELKRRKELEQLTLKMFQMVYDDYQQGKFHRIL